MAVRGLPGSWYGDPALHARLVERAFVPSWQPGPSADAVVAPGEVAPWTLAPGALDEPVVTTRAADGALRTLSNVCTHRGARVVDRPCRAASLRCPYHGRRFGLGGRVEASPGFPERPEGADLPGIPTEVVGPVVFASLGGGPSIAARAGAAWARVAPLLARPMAADPSGDRAHPLDVSWLLYVENYLEGLHVPFVHPALARAIDLASYAVEVLPGGVLQVADGDEAFDLPVDHPDRGRPVAAYYLWLFPDLMLNVYPWGLSLNHVQPTGPQATRVVYRRWVADPARLGRGAGGDLDKVEAEDQAVVRRVQEGVRARLYRPGALAPGHEDGVAALHAMVRGAADGG